MGATQGEGRRRAKEETAEERALRLLKEDVAEELGLLGKVRAMGWGGLSARETGRVGGVLARRLREGDSLRGDAAGGAADEG